MTGPLKAPCPHGRYEEHPCIAGKWVSQLRLMRITDDERPLLSLCPGGTPLAEDTLVIVKEDGEWPEWARDLLHYDVAMLAECDEVEILDALAAAQRGDE